MSTRASYVVVIACALLVAAPVLVAPYPPMTDFAHHEGLVGLLRHFGDAAMFPPGLYVKNLGHPNQLFHLLAWPLSYALGVTLACKVVTSAALAGIVLGAARLARHVGATPLAALALGPVALGWLFTWGFVTNLVGLALFFALLPTLDRMATSPTPRAVAAATGAAVLLYFGHELMLLVFLGAVGLFALLTADGVKGFVVRVTPIVATSAIVVAQLVFQERLKTATVRNVPNVWTSVPAKIGEVPGVLVGGSDRGMRTLVFGLLVVFLAALAATRIRTARAAAGSAAAPSPSSLAEWRTRLAPFRFEILAASAFVLYLVAPFTFNGAMLVHERFLAPAFGIAAVMAGVRVRPALPIVAVGALAPLASLAMQLPWFADSSANYRNLETLFAEIPLGSSVAAIDLDLDQGGRPFSVASSQSRVLARRGGRVLYSFVDSPISPVMMDPRWQWNESSSRIMLDNPKFRPSHDLTRFRWLLLHSSKLQRLPVAAVAMQREARLVDAAGEWMLFESKLPVVPLLSPDVPLPEPHPETLARRMFFLEHPTP